MRATKAYTVTYNLCENNSILIRTIIGEITMLEIIELWEADIKSERVTTDLKAVITDLTKGINLSKMEDRKSITAYYRKNVDFFKNIKMVVVLNDTTIAIPLMFEHENRDIKHSSFSTLEAAIKWARK